MCPPRCECPWRHLRRAQPGRAGLRGSHQTHPSPAWPAPGSRIEHGGGDLSGTRACSGGSGGPEGRQRAEREGSAACLGSGGRGGAGKGPRGQPRGPQKSRLGRRSKGEGGGTVTPGLFNHSGRLIGGQSQPLARSSLTPLPQSKPAASSHSPRVPAHMIGHAPDAPRPTLRRLRRACACSTCIAAGCVLHTHDDRPSAIHLPVGPWVEATKGKTGPSGPVCHAHRPHLHRAHCAILVRAKPARGESDAIYAAWRGWVGRDANGGGGGQDGRHRAEREGSAVLFGGRGGGEGAGKGPWGQSREEARSRQGRRSKGEGGGTVAPRRITITTPSPHWP